MSKLDQIRSTVQHSIVNSIDLNNFKITSKSSPKIRFHKNNIQVLKLDNHLLIKEEAKNFDQLNELINKCNQSLANSIQNALKDNLINHCFTKPTYTAEHLNKRYSSYDQIELKGGLIALFQVKEVIAINQIKAIEEEILVEHQKEYVKKLKEAMIENPNITEDEKANLLTSNEKLQTLMMDKLMRAKMEETEEIEGYTIDICFIFKMNIAE
jgi:hypothetical protein